VDVFLILTGGEERRNCVNVRAQHNFGFPVERQNIGALGSDRLELDPEVAFRQVVAQEGGTRLFVARHRFDVDQSPSQLKKFHDAVAPKLSALGAPLHVASEERLRR
jgi:hypothetical protein